MLTLASYATLLALSSVTLLARGGAVAVTGRSLFRANGLILAVAAIECVVERDGLSRWMLALVGVLLALSWLTRHTLIILGGDPAKTSALIVAALGRVRAPFHEESAGWTLTGGVRPAVIHAAAPLSGLLLLRFSGGWNENRSRLAVALIGKGFRGILPVLRIRIQR